MCLLNFSTLLYIIRLVHAQNFDQKKSEVHVSQKILLKTSLEFYFKNENLIYILLVHKA